MSEKKPLVSCLTATAGRFSVLREAVACFLAQDYPEKELVILNNHPTPLVCDLPGVWLRMPRPTSSDPATRRLHKWWSHPHKVNLFPMMDRRRSSCRRFLFAEHQAQMFDVLHRCGRPGQER